MRLAETEYGRVVDTVGALQPEDWARPTDCTGWDVRQLVAHIAGMARFISTPLEMARQMRGSQAGQQKDEALIDAQTALQVDERQHLRPDELQAELRRAAPRAAKGRRRTPAVLRRLRLPGTQLVNGAPETWSLGFLTDVILTRDPWMHRTDIGAATGAPLTLTAEHDGVLVADVVAEWAARHGQPCQLELTGPAGGTWSFGEGGDRLELDAVSFCRALSGRGSADGLLAVEVPF
jgi:uncharacterized protein (TIGR03083 family)